MAIKITNDLIIAIVKQCYEDLDEMARLFTLYYNTPECDMPKYIRLVGHYIGYANKKQCMEYVNNIIVSELKGMTIAIDLTDCIADASHIWCKLTRKIRQSYPLFYRLYEPELERLLDYAKNKC